MNPNVLHKADWTLVAPIPTELADVTAGLAPPVRKRESASAEEVEACYLHEPPLIEVDASSDQLRKLFARLQTQWQALGAAEPFFSVLTLDEYKLTNLDECRRAEFYTSGQEQAKLIDIFCKRVGTDVKRGICVELGCGVGRVTQHLAGLFEKVIALDISEGNLLECTAMVKTNGLTNVETRLLRSVTDLEDLPEFDFLFSVLVLQHNPPPVQKSILDILFQKIQQGGGFLVQAQTYHPDYSFSIDDYLSRPAEKTMEMHSLPMHQIMQLAEKYGLLMREVLPDNLTGRFGSQTFFATSGQGTENRFAVDHLDTHPLNRLNAEIREDLKQHAARLGLDRISRQEEAVLPARSHRYVPIQSLWGRINSYLNSLKHLTKTRRTAEWIDRDLDGLNTAIVQTDARLTVLEETHQRSCDLLEKLQEQTESHLSTLSERHASDTRMLQDQQENSYLALEGRLARYAHELDEQKTLLRFERATRQKSFTDFDRRLATYAFRNTKEKREEANATASPQTPGLQSLLESFYFLLEERYRGTRAEIKQRLTVYRPDFEAARKRLQCSGPVIDLGCGRGELLELLRDEGFQVLGIDQNDLQLDAARQHGLPVLHEDARTYLASLADDSVLAVSGIHIAEHIPFPALTALMQQIARVLKTGGLLLFETPNPRNLIVGANTFHFDPTHIKPLPPEVLEILFETCGFINLDTRLLHASSTLQDVIVEKRLDPQIAQLLFGPQDYAVLGIKG